jgi:sulfite exporter TauE/SafE
MIALITAFSVGLLGSFHCIGMCGAIAFSLPLQEQNWYSKLWGGLVYNLGRISTYGVLGFILGLLGKGFSLAGFQQSLSIFLGVFILIVILFPKYIQLQKNKSSLLAQLQLWVRQKMGLLFKNNSTKALYGIGLLNGLLPCGLVYAGLAGAIGTGQGWIGALYMISFGLGTLPIMILASQFRGFISINVRNRMRQVVPFFMGLMAVLFIIRGLNLGIPYLSPILQSKATSWILPANCH